MRSVDQFVIPISVRSPLRNGDYPACFSVGPKWSSRKLRILVGEGECECSHISGHSVQIVTHFKRYVTTVDPCTFQSLQFPHSDEMRTVVSLSSNGVQQRWIGILASIGEGPRLGEQFVVRQRTP